MRTREKRSGQRALALMLAAIVAVTMAPVSVEAKPPKPALNKGKLTITKGKKAKLKICNVKSKDIKKTVWTWNKGGKKVVSCTKKTKTSIVLKGKKKGTVKVTAKIKISGKTYKRSAKVTVKLSENKKKSGEDEHEKSAPTKAPNQEKDEPVRTDTPDNMTSTPQRTDWVPTITPETETEVPGQETEIPRTEEPDVVLNYSVLDNPSTKLLPSGEITAEGQKPVSGTDTFKLINGQLKGTFHSKNVSVILDLGRDLNLEKCGGVEIEGIVPGQLALEFYDNSFDLYKTKDKGYDTDWWETTIGHNYPFYQGSCPWRYENGGINYLKLAQNGYTGSDYPDVTRSVTPAKESMRFSLGQLTGSMDSGAWDKVRYIVIKSNQAPCLSDQYSFDGETEVEYTITGLKFLEEEVIEDKDMGHHIIYDPEAEDADMNIASESGNTKSYYVDEISGYKTEDERDTTMNLSDFKYIKVKVEDTDAVKVGLVADGKTVRDTRIIGEDATGGDRSVYVSLEDVEKTLLKNVDQVTVETDEGGRVTWVSATKGEIRFDETETKIDVKNGVSTVVTLEAYGIEGAGWVPDSVVSTKPSEVPDASQTPAAPYELTISEEMEADVTKDREDYRQDVDWSVPGQVTFTNVRGYNGGLALKLQKSGKPINMSAYRYIEAEVETHEKGGDSVFLKSFVGSNSMWDNIDNGKFEMETMEGRRTVRFDITDYGKSLSSMGAIMISPRGDGTIDVHTSMTLYNVRFVSEGWVDEPDKTSPPPVEPATLVELTGDDLGESATFLNGGGIGRHHEPAYVNVNYGQLKDAESIVMEVEKTATDFEDIQLKTTIGGLGTPSAIYCGFDSLTGAKIKETYDRLTDPGEELTDDTRIRMAVQTTSIGLTGKVTIKSLTVDGEAIDISDQTSAEWDYENELAPADDWDPTAYVKLAGYDLTKYSGLIVEYDCDDPACEVFADIGVNYFMPSQRQYTEQQGKIVVNLDEEITLDDPNPGINSSKMKEYDSADTYSVYLRMCPGTTLSVGKSVTITKLILLPRVEA